MFVSFTMFVSKTAEQNRLSRVHDCRVSRETLVCIRKTAARHKRGSCHEFITTTMNKWGLDAIFCEAADGAVAFLPRKRERGPGRARVSIWPLPLMALQ